MNKPLDVPADVVVEHIPISVIALSRSHYQEQRRKTFDNERLLELAANIKQIGVQQPIVVRHIAARDNKNYEIVFGERRLLAADRAGMAHVPCIIRPLSDDEVVLAQLTENKQREDDNPLAEAEGYAELKELKGYDAGQIGELIGKSRSYVFSRLKLRDLSTETRLALMNGEIDYSKALLIARFGTKLQAKALKRVRGSHVSYQNAFVELRHNLMADLSKAPFALDDERRSIQIGPRTFAWERGACATCEHNSVNDPDLQRDCNGAHVCTDEPCFKVKTEAYWAERTAQAESAGRTVLTGDAAKAAVPHRYAGFNDQYVRLDAECEEAAEDDSAESDAEPPAWPTFGTLLADAGLTSVLAETSEGLVELVPVAAAAAALKAKGVTIRVPGGADDDLGSSEEDRARYAAERARDEERQKVEFTYRKRVFAEIFAKWKGPLKRPDLERVATELHNNYQDEFDALSELYPDGIDFPRLKDDELSRYIVLNLIADDTSIHGGKPGKLMEVAQRLRIDMKKIRSDVVRELKPVSAPPEEPPATDAPPAAAKKKAAPKKKVATKKKPATKK